MVFRKSVGVSVLISVLACNVALAGVSPSSLDDAPPGDVTPVGVSRVESPVNVMPDRIIRFSSTGEQQITTPVTSQAVRKRIPAITHMTFLGVLTALAVMISLALVSYVRAGIRVRAASRAREAQILREVAIATARLKHASAGAPAVAASAPGATFAAASLSASSSTERSVVRTPSLRSDQDENSYHNWNARRAGLAGFDPHRSRSVSP